MGNRLLKLEAEHLKTILNDYGKALAEASDRFYADEDDLPHTKKAIKEAIVSALKSSYNEEVNRQLKISYVELAK